METSSKIITEQILETLLFSNELRNDLTFRYNRSTRVRPYIYHANDFNESLEFVKMFDDFLLHVREGCKNPLDLVSLIDEKYPHTVYSIEKELIPFLKETKRTIQIISRNRKTSFGSNLSNKVLLGEFLENFTSELNKTICSIKEIFAESTFAYKHDRIYLPKWYSLNIYQDLVSKIPQDILTNIVIKTKDKIFDHGLVLDSSRSNAIGNNRSYFNQSSGAYESKDYIQKTLICILENVYFYLAIFLCIYYNYLIGAGALYNKKKDRHRVLIPENRSFCGLSGISYGYQCIYSDTRQSSFIGILGILFSAIDNAQQTVQENIITIKNLVMSISSLKKDNVLQGIEDLDKINLVFSEFKKLSSLLYDAFFVNSPIENIILSCKKSDSVSNVFSNLVLYIYNNFENIDQKLVEKISFEHLRHIRCLPVKSVDSYGNNFIIVERDGQNFNDKNAHPYIITASLGKKDFDQSANISFMDYWVNKAEKPLMILTLPEFTNNSGLRNLVYPDASTSLIVQVIFNRYREKVDKFTGDTPYTDPLNFKFLSTQMFPIVSPGARDYEKLAKRKLTIQEKVGISLLIFGPNITNGREDNPWKSTSSVPELGIRVSYEKE